MYVAIVADDGERESSREIEFYGELGIMPKFGAKIRFARKARVDHMIESAADFSDLGRAELEERLAASSGRVHDVLLMAAMRASEVDDDEYLDVLGRLVAGALDPAAIDELAYVTAEIIRLEPIHLRALFDFFHFGRQGEDNAVPDLSPADSAWANARVRAEREVAYTLGIGRETTSHVLLRLNRDGLVENGGAAVDGETISVPTDWGCRVMSLLFPELKVERDDVTVDPRPARSAPLVPAQASSMAAPGDETVREHRAINELETEIKSLERLRHTPGGLDIMGGDAQWLATLKRRLRSVDPNNPWASSDWS